MDAEGRGGKAEMAGGFAAGGLWGVDDYGRRLWERLCEGVWVADVDAVVGGAAATIADGVGFVDELTVGLRFFEVIALVL